MIIEICATSLNSIINAQNAGADRIELCEEYLIGGVTPSIDFLDKSIKISKIPINILIRPRGGNFHFNNNEIDKMFESINNFKKFKIKGFVVGLLDASNNLDPKILEEFRSQTLGYDLTFHRAFDYLVDQTKSLELLIENKFDRILCSGSKIDSEKGIENLINFKQIANDNITIMPGGGINPKNFNLFKESGFQQIHLSGINKKISLDSDFNIIREIIEMSK